MRPNPELAQALSAARVQTDKLFEVVRADALYERPIPERHRMIFYLGHLEAFDWNLFGRAVDLPKSNPELDQLFSFGIDPGSDDLPADQPSDWPRIGEVRQYNAKVRETVDAILSDVPEQYMHVAIEHRLMHAETFAYMLHNLAFEHKVVQQEVAAPSVPPQQTGMVEIKGGTAILGRKRGNGFGWDNEFDEVRCVVPAFAISRHKVSNGDYLEFVRQGAAAPHFWMCRNGSWFYRGMFQDIPLPLDWPVYVSQLEAREYAAWKGKSLPSEAQFHRAAYGSGPMDLAHENVDFRRWDPVPVTSGTPNGLGVSQMVGNGWEWTSTKFAPFPGFEPFPFYAGYSANFFDGEHYVLKGGSPRTAACMLRSSFRNWFRPAYPYVYATFRLVEN